MKQEDHSQRALFPINSERNRISVLCFFHSEMSLFVVVCLLSHVKLLCDTMDGSPPGSSVHGISQARILECVAIPFSKGSSPPRDRFHVSALAGGFFEH